MVQRPIVFFFNTVFSANLFAASNTAEFIRREKYKNSRQEGRLPLDLLPNMALFVFQCTKTSRKLLTESREQVKWQSWREDSQKYCVVCQRTYVGDGKDEEKIMGP